MSLIYSSWSCTWFLGHRWGLLVPCALEMHSEAPIIVTFPCGPRILAEFGMVAFAWCSATSFGVFHVCSAWAGCKNLHSLSSRVDKPFFCKNYKQCLQLPTFFVLRLLSCCGVTKPQGAAMTLQGIGDNSTEIGHDIITKVIPC